MRTLALLAVLAVSAAAENPRLVQSGSRSWWENGAVRSVEVYKLVVGDPSRAEQLAMARQGMGHFAQNAAMYFPNEDGTWRMRNYRVPEYAGPEAERDAFIDELRRPDVAAIVEDADNIVDFGAPENYVYTRRSIPREQLPSPWNRLSPAALKDVVMIMRFNGDGTQKAFIRTPEDQGEAAQAVLSKMLAELR